MNSDTIRLICPNLKCRSILTAPISARGKTVRCSECGMKVRIPGPATSPEPASSAKPAAPSSDAAPKA